MKFARSYELKDKKLENGVSRPFEEDSATTKLMQKSELATANSKVNSAMTISGRGLYQVSSQTVDSCDSVTDSDANAFFISSSVNIGALVGADPNAPRPI